VAASSSLVLWLVADDYDGSGTWHDESGRHADATCASCPSVVSDSTVGHKVLAFDGTDSFVVADPQSNFSASAFSIWVVALPDPAAASGAQLLTFSTATASVGLARSAATADLVFGVTSGADTSSVTAAGAWTAAWQVVSAGASGTTGFVGSTSVAITEGTITTPASVDYTGAYVGADPARTSLFTGRIAEVVVFKTASAPANVLTYLKTKYAIP